MKKKRYLFISILLVLTLILLLRVEYFASVSEKWIESMEENDKLTPLTFNHAKLSNEELQIRNTRIANYLLENDNIRKNLKAENSRLKIHIYIVVLLMLVVPAYFVVTIKVNQ
jgi:hypothetical protein